MTEIVLKAHAKINLTLEILRRLPTGYHEVTFVMQELDLHDDVWIHDRADNEIVLHCDAPDVPLDQSNLAWKAAMLLRKHTGVTRGASISIAKRIPIAGGMAGGSSNAAATLRGLNQLWQLGLSEADLITLGAEIGMDVPFSVLGGTALATGRGEIVESIPALPPFHVVVANPGVHVSTKEAYQSLDWSRMPSICVTPAMVSAVEQQDRPEIMRLLHNDFEISLLERLPKVRQIKEIMLEHGAPNAILSGSGPSFFCLLESQAQADAIVSALKPVVPFVVATRTKAKPAFQAVNPAVYAYQPVRIPPLEVPVLNREAAYAA